MTALARFSSPIGSLSVEADDAGVCGVTFGWRGKARPAVTALTRENLEAGLLALRTYFAGGRPVLPRLDLHGTPFQLAVWQELLTIPYGEQRTYGEVAQRLGRPGAARAVGGANHLNPIAILVPCHRVVASGGKLGGYNGGLEVKSWLLAHEAGHAPALR